MGKKIKVKVAMLGSEVIRCVCCDGPFTKADYNSAPAFGSDGVAHERCSYDWFAKYRPDMLAGCYPEGRPPKSACGLPYDGNGGWTWTEGGVADVVKARKKADRKRKAAAKPKVETDPIVVAYRKAAKIIEKVSPRDSNALNIRTTLAEMEAVTARIPA